MRTEYIQWRKAYKKDNHLKQLSVSNEAFIGPKLPNRREGRSTTVYPFKRDEDILAMQHYLLTHGRTHLRARNYLYFMLGISLGRRGGDLTRLKWGDLLDTNGNFLEENVKFIMEEKTRKLFSLILNDTARTAITQYLSWTGITPNVNDYVFKSQITGEEWVGNDQMCRVIKAAAKAIGIKYNIGTHSLRKTLGYRLYKSGAELELISIIFNHSNTRETLHYIGIDDERKAQAFEDAAAPMLDCANEIMGADTMSATVSNTTCDAKTPTISTPHVPVHLRINSLLEKRGKLPQFSEVHGSTLTPTNPQSRPLISEVNYFVSRVNSTNGCKFYDLPALKWAVGT